MTARQHTQMEMLPVASAEIPLLSRIASLQRLAGFSRDLRASILCSCGNRSIRRGCLSAIFIGILFSCHGHVQGNSVRPTTGSSMECGIGNGRDPKEA